MSTFPLFYSGSVGYFQSLLAADSVQFEVHEHFIKQTQRNRLEILGPNGRQLLVIPTLKSAGKRTTGNVKISHAENWQKEHSKSLEAAYQRSPYFEFYEHEFEPFYVNKIELLSDFNLQFMKTILRLLKLDLNHTKTDEYVSNENDLRISTFPLLEDKQYLQVFGDRHPFEPNLSILDALFNLGPQSAGLIIS
jgi:hypothetical protein